MGRAAAWRTLSDTLEGPGPVSVFKGTLMGWAREGGEGTSRVILRFDCDVNGTEMEIER